MMKQVLTEHNEGNGGGIASKSDIDKMIQLLSKPDELDNLRQSQLDRLLNLIKMAYTNPDSIKSLIIQEGNGVIEIGVKIKC